MRKIGLSYCLTMAVTVFLTSLPSAEPSPAGGVMIGLNAARAIKKHKEKNGQAQAAGAPVIAYGCGGGLRRSLPVKRGSFFDQADPGALASAIRDFEARS